MKLPQGIGVTRSKLKLALAFFRLPDGPSLALLRDDRYEFRWLWPRGDHQIIVAHDPEAPDISAHDEYSWLRRFYAPLRGPVLGAQWAVIEAVATPPAFATATAPVRRASVSPHRQSVSLNHKATARMCCGHTGLRKEWFGGGRLRNASASPRVVRHG
jgi:hypothetical protein